MDKNKEAKERIRMLNALATVSSLAVMIVCDFLLAYFGGDWLDNYFQTGDHTFRVAFFKLIYSVMIDKDE